MDEQPLRAFEIEALALEQVVGGLDEAEFDRPTNCPPWTVRDLIGHICQHIGADEVPPSAPGAQPELRQAADFYRSPIRRTAAYHEEIARTAVEFAASFESGADLARELAARWRETMTAFVEIAPDTVVRSPQGTCHAAAFLTTRVIAHSAHGLDLALSLGLSGWTTREALAVMRPVFVSLAGFDPTDRTGWDEATLFAAATGRRMLTVEEESMLDARLFPLLS